MEKLALGQLVEAQLEAARGNGGRSTALLVQGEHSSVFQVLLALTEGGVLEDHGNPGDATLQVVRGRMRLRVGEAAVDLGEGDHVVIPHADHRVDGLTDSAGIITTGSGD